MSRAAWWNDLLTGHVVHIAEHRPGRHVVTLYSRGMRTGAELAFDRSFSDALRKALALNAQGVRIIIDLECWKPRS
jgi:hypothetical protein